MPTGPRAGPPVAPLADGGEAPVAWRVVAADFVTTDSGTGIVHIAPAFGEVDYTVLLAEQSRFAPGKGPTLINCVAPDGTFTDAFGMGSGRFVKDCDRDITRDLKARGLLVHQEQYVHDYPFCWRADNDPLIQYPRQSWFIRTSQFRDAMLANNATIEWLPRAHQGRPLRQLPGDERRSGAVPRAVLGHAAADLGVRGDGHDGGGAVVCRALAKPGVAGTDVFAKAKAADAFALRRSPGSQAVYRRRHLRLTVRSRSPDAAGARR